MASIEELKSAISINGGLAKQNRFRVILPEISRSSVSMRDLDIFCSSVTVPGKQITTIEKQVGGLQSKVAYGHLFTESTMEFLVPENYGIKKYFTEWQNLTFDPVTLEPGYKSDYAKSVIVQQLSARNDSILYQLELLKAFPVTVGDLNYNNEANGLIRLPVTFSFNRYFENYVRA